MRRSSNDETIGQSFPITVTKVGDEFEAIAPTAPGIAPIRADDFQTAARLMNDRLHRLVVEGYKDEF